MAVFEVIITLLFVGAMLAALARRMKVPYPALLALSGAALALLPGAPSVSLDPQLALTLFVAPVLLDAAYDSSPRDLKEHWRVVLGLAVLGVGFTVVAVAFAARWALPQLSWPAAFALGAIVAPPDAAAATAVLRQLRLPHRVLVILEGESLFNDATALLIYRLAVAAAVTGTMSGWSVVPMLAAVAAGSVGLGVVLSRIALVLTTRIRDVATAVIVQFLSTFAVWLIAERLGLSEIITVVVFAIILARTAPERTPARLRIPSYAVWEVAVFVLNVLAFIIVGLQLKPILQRLNGTELATYTTVALTVCAAVILVRIAWVTFFVAVARWFAMRRKSSKPARIPSFRIGAVIAWCGMRGIVTLAAALALPDGGPGRFPYRDLILFTAFCVVLVTLVAQGMTVRPLIHILKIRDDGSVGDEVRLARAETARAALDEVENAGPAAHITPVLRHKYEERLRRAEKGGSQPEADRGPGFASVQRRAHAAERQTLSDLRSNGVIGDDAFHTVEEELDWAELNAEGMERGN